MGVAYGPNDDKIADDSDNDDDDGEASIVGDEYDQSNAMKKSFSEAMISCIETSIFF